MNWLIWLLDVGYFLVAVVVFRRSYVKVTDSWLDDCAEYRDSYDRQRREYQENIIQWRRAKESWFLSGRRDYYSERDWEGGHPLPAEPVFKLPKKPSYVLMAAMALTWPLLMVGSVMFLSVKGIRWLSAHTILRPTPKQRQLQAIEQQQRIEQQQIELRRQTEALFAQIQENHKAKTKEES